MFDIFIDFKMAKRKYENSNDILNTIIIFDLENPRILKHLISQIQFKITRNCSFPS